MPDTVLTSPLIVNVAASRDAKVDGRKFTKEFAYESELFVTNVNGAAVQLPIDQQRMNTWVDSFNRMKEVGYAITVPLGHNFDPKARLGEVQNYRVAKDSKGRSGIFADLVFDETVPEADVQAYAKADVSLFLEPWLDSGTGQMREAVTHIAVTGQPQVPGLDKFVMALSMPSSFSKDFKVPINSHLQKLATKFKVDISKADTDEAVFALLDAFQVPEAAPAALPAAAPTAAPTLPLSRPSDDPKFKTVVTSMAETIAASRNTILDGLVGGKTVLPAQTADLAKEYANAANIALAIDNGTLDTQTKAFNLAVAALSRGGQKFGFERTRVQNPSETLPDGQKESGIVALARQRAAAAAAAAK